MPPDEEGTPGTASPDAATARAERAARFAAAHADIELSPPLLVAGALLLAWWLLLAWQAAAWWPRAAAATGTATGVARLEDGIDGRAVALVVGQGADARRFDCAGRGVSWRVLHVPLVRCDADRDVLRAAAGREVRIDYDRPEAGGHAFLRVLALAVEGRPVWRADDSVAAFSWQLWRAAFAGVLLLVPGWFLHRRWPAPA